MSAEDFHARWAKRNAATTENAENAAFGAPQKQGSITNTHDSNTSLAHINHPLTDVSSEEYKEKPAPTLDEAQAMTPQSDFTRVMKKDVDANVKNTALKKLWTDPRYNIQDGLDTYIDDYSKPDPMPPGMLEKLAHMSFLTIFDKKPEDDEKAGASKTQQTEDKTLPSPQPSPADAGEGAKIASPAVAGEGAKIASPAVAGEGARTELKTDTEPHENADLQLQPNDAAGRESDQHGTR
jgi:Protein of unknown function (DUF3306)